jgi:hypothetical protein
MKLLDLKPSAYNYYIKNVKNNQDTSFQRAREKLSRNVECGYSYGFDGFNREIIMYGCLRIIVKDGTVVWLDNYKGGKYPYDIDLHKYEKINKELGIVN